MLLDLLVRLAIGAVGMLPAVVGSPWPLGVALLLYLATLAPDDFDRLRLGAN